MATVDELYTSLSKEYIDVGLWSNHSIMYHINNVHCDLTTVGIEFSQSSYHLPMKKDWIYKEDLDFGLASLVGSDAFDLMRAKWFSPRLCAKSNADDTNPKQLTLKQTGGLFLVFFIASIITSVAKFWSIIPCAGRMNEAVRPIHDRLFPAQSQRILPVT